MGPRLSIISYFFAEDNIMFSRATVDEANVISSIIEFYEATSSPKINI